MIDVRNLTYSYPNSDKPTLRNITFAVEPGESIGIIGPNGAGKSTLCYALMGLVPHFYHGTIAGDVFIDGVNVLKSYMGELSRHVGLVFQNPTNQFSGAKLTVEEEIAFGLENLGVDRVTMLERIDWVTELLGIAGIRKRNPYHLSGGQMQRVAIASVMALKPKVLVLDEPTSQLDPVGTAEVFAAIEMLRKEGVTTVVVEHKTELLVEHCSRLIVLVDGELKAYDTPSHVFSHQDVEQWGIEVPRYSQAYRAIVPDADTVPTTLTETTERLRQYELSHRR
jgi:energy-coupling factor transport system ATP-binding protein